MALKRTPRWLAVLFGLCFLGLAVLLFVAGVEILRETMSPGDPDWPLISAFLGMAFVSGVSATYGWRLVTGRPRRYDGGLVSPEVIRVFAVGFFAISLGELVTGRWRDLMRLFNLHPDSAALDALFAVLHVLGIFGLVRLASYREEKARRARDLEKEKLFVRLAAGDQSALKEWRR